MIKNNDLLRWGAQQLVTVVPKNPNIAWIEARTLLIDCLGLKDYNDLFPLLQNPTEAWAKKRYESHLKKRLDGHPIAYILNWREFYCHRFKTTNAALIPRPESECLVIAALPHLPKDTPTHIIDLGSGSGVLGISVGLARQKSFITFTDISAEALHLTEENIKALGLTNYHCVQSDWYDNLNQEKRYDMIVSNPPYIAHNDAHLQQADLRFEPIIALEGGECGLACLKKVISNAPYYLKRGGILLVEHGYNQATDVRQLMSGAGFCGIRQEYDFANIPRFSMGFYP